MPDALPATTLPISWHGDWLKICWLAYPETRPSGGYDHQQAD